MLSTAQHHQCTTTWFVRYLALLVFKISDSQNTICSSCFYLERTRIRSHTNCVAIMFCRMWQGIAAGLWLHLQSLIFFSLPFQWWLLPHLTLHRHHSTRAGRWSWKRAHKPAGALPRSNVKVGGTLKSNVLNDTIKLRKLLSLGMSFQRVYEHNWVFYEPVGYLFS